MSIRFAKPSQWFEMLYKMSIGVKGVDGLVELVAGLLLAFSPGVLHAVLSGIAGEAGGHPGQVHHFVAEHIARLDDDLVKSGLGFLVFFLIGHGIVKLALVYCLLKHIVRAYPWALGVLVLFLVYQLYVLVQDISSIGMWLVTLLDALIIWFVYEEYKKLKWQKGNNRVE